MSPPPPPQKESTSCSVQCESDAFCVFWLWGRNSSWISIPLPDGEQELVSEGDEKAERSSEEERAWFVKGKKRLLHHDNALALSAFWFVIFSQSMRQCLSLSLCTWQTLHQQTSFSSPRWNPYWEDRWFESLKEIKENPLRVKYKKWMRVLWSGLSPIATK